MKNQQHHTNSGHFGNKAQGMFQYGPVSKNRITRLDSDFNSSSNHIYMTNYHGGMENQRPLSFKEKQASNVVNLQVESDVSLLIPSLGDYKH